LKGVIILIVFSVLLLVPVGAQNVFAGIAICGDGIVNGVEECDNGFSNSDIIPDSCRSNCKLPACGDQIIDTGEQCDDGIINNFAGGACSTQCIAAFCGDGIIFDATSGGTEQCDDGNAADGDGCSSSCLVETVSGFDCGFGTTEDDGECVVDPTITQQLAQALVDLGAALAQITNLEAIITELEALLGEEDVFTLEECQKFQELADKRTQDGKDIPKGLQQNLETCAELFP